MRVAEAFDRFDSDHSGYIDRRELRAALRHYGVDLSTHGVLGVMARYDEQPDGLMDLREFSDLVYDLEERTLRAEPVRPAALPPPTPAPTSPPKPPPSTTAVATMTLPPPPAPATPTPSQPVAAPPTAASSPGGASSSSYGGAPAAPPSSSLVVFDGAPAGSLSARGHAPARQGSFQAPRPLAGDGLTPAQREAFTRSADGFDQMVWEHEAGVRRCARTTMSERKRLSVSGHAELRLTGDYERAARALRAEGKELLGVLSQLKQRCGPSTLSLKPGSTGRRVGIRLSFERSQINAGDRTALMRLANIAGLRNAIIEPAIGGVRVTFIEDYPPPLHDLPARLHAHAHALGEALRGHHERAINLFLLVAEHFLGVPTHPAVERKPPVSPAYDLPARVTGEHDPAPVYPEVPRLEMAAGYSATETQQKLLQSI